jgi:hypothetical protein
MDKVSLIRMVAIAAVIPLAVNPVTPDPPSPGESCAVLNAVTQDNHGHMMSCTQMIDGPNHPVWLYAGAS